MTAQKNFTNGIRKFTLSILSTISQLEKETDLEKIQVLCESIECDAKLIQELTSFISDETFELLNNPNDK